VLLPPLVAAGAVAASLVMAWLSYRFVEQPFRKHPPAGFGRPAIFAMSAAVIVVLGVTGEALHQSKGWPQRLPPEIGRIVAAAQDRNPRREECFGRVPADGLCTIGAPGGEAQRIDFVLLGDSHGEMLMPGIERAAAKAGQYGKFAGYTGCLPGPTLERVAKCRDCTRYNAAVWSWLEQRKDIDTVIIAARWTLWVEGTRPDGELGDDSQLRRVGTADLRTSGDNAALLESALADIVDRLNAGGRRVVLVGPVPEAVNDVPIDTARRMLIGLQQPPQRTRAQFTARAARTEAMPARIAARSDRVSYVPLSDLLCDRTVCRAFGPDGVPYYVDDDHITRTTAETLLRPRLETIWSAPAK